MKSLLFQTLLYGLISGAMLIPLVVSFNLIYSTTRAFHFSHATLCLLAVYTAWRVQMLFGFPMWLALIVGVAIAVAISVMLSQWVYLPLVRRKVSDVSLLMAALGLFVVLEHATVLIFGPDPHVYLDMQGGRLLQIGPARLNVMQAWIMLAIFLSICVIWVALLKSRMGLQIRAFGNSQDLARVLGASDHVVMIWTMLLATSLGTVSAIGQVSYSGIISPDMSASAAIATAACSAVFGVQRPFWGIGAALILGVGQAFSGLLFGSGWQESFVLVLMVAALAIRRKAPLEA